MATFQERVVGVLKLEQRMFEEIEADQNATGQAMLVVVGSAVAAGIGAITAGVGALFFTLIAALIGWFLWAFLTFIIGTKLLPEAQTNADLGQMLRVVGFAAAPGFLNILGIIPLLGWLVWLVAMVWQLMAMVIGVRQALDFSSTGRAVLVCIIGWFVYMVIFMVAGAMFGGLMLMSGR